MARKINKWVLGQIKPETLLETKMTELKLLYFRDIIRRQDSLENIILSKNRMQLETRRTN